MTLQKTIRTLLAASAVFAMLLLLTQTGEALEAWQHQECTNTCSICHLAQLAVGAALTVRQVVVFERIGLLAIPSAPALVLSSCERQLAARAPPSI